MSRSLKFRISSALKDIIGRDLITDDFIAVFELVKNSFDAHASTVDIRFENIHSNDSKIVIKDNGKGMSYDDLLNKWLFVAYSAKREGTEDDYRNKIHGHRPYAGAKGIGRFSCDRLGKFLQLETKKINQHTSESLFIDWEQFENDMRTEFVQVNVLHESKENDVHELEHGTTLEISSLRSSWSREKLLKLKSALAKLITPDRESDNFKINIHVLEEEANDESYSEAYNRVNGEVYNFIFDRLGLKTTKILSSISNDSQYITTELYDGGTLIYKIFEENKFNLLSGVSTTLYYLNQSAKNTFTRYMGVTSANYGHVFLYKNGFRVYPYGEPGEDPLKIDVRKGVGLQRYLGTREIIGQIEILLDSNELKETSSRGDGLIKTETYYQLENFFWDTLKRLEKYVVDVQRWGISIEDDESNDFLERAKKLVIKLTESISLISIEHNERIFDILQTSQSESAETAVRNLNRIAHEIGGHEIIREAKIASARLKEIKQAKKELEVEKDLIQLEKESIQEQLFISRRENELLKEATNEDIVELMAIEHHINQATYRVDGYIGSLFSIAKQVPSFKNEIINQINMISLENRKIASLVKFVRKANFDLLSANTQQDLVQYIEEYIKNVYKKDYVKIINKKLVKTVNINFNSSIKFIRTFVPLEINIILDNLLDNSQKASADKVEIILSVSNGELLIDYQDNGTGVDPNVKDRIFDFGVTTTKSGSGIGLYHVKKISNDMGGDIWLKNNKFGANFIIKIPK